ncbi:MAG: DUF6240 domain-containing protein [Lachnotalea sp.]
MDINNNITELNNISKKLEFNNTQKAIDNITQKVFSTDAFLVDTGTDKNQLFKIGDTTQEDLQDALAGEKSDFVKGAMIALGNTTTSQDLTKLDEEGYDLEDTDVNTVVTVTDKIQIYLATHCDDYQVTGDISMDEIKQVTANNTQLAYDIAKKLQESNLPITKDNVEESLEAMELASQLNPITDGAAKYMLNNDLDPTIENAYKAEYSGQSTIGGTYGAGYFTEGTGYYGKTSDEFNWDGLQEQMSKVIESADLEVNEDTLTDAKWLVQNHIPLTEDTMKGYETLKDIDLPVDSKATLDNIIQALQEGKRPSQALLSQVDSYAVRAEDACNVINNTTDETIKTVIAREQPINIYNLKKAQESETDRSVQGDKTTKSATQTSGVNTTSVESSTTSSTTSSTASTISTTTADFDIQVSDDNIAFITARRQLEEIRLQMTSEANYKLLKQGISIETQDLKSLIENLKNAEDSYYKQLLSNNNIDETDENINSLKEITTKISDIKYVPNTVLASVVAGETPNTINGIHTTGTILKSTYDTANQSYEALMTKPRSDMGDQITKAFQNVDDILNDLELDTTESNRRAVRILGYNSMDITTDNINAVKAADAAVSSTISNLTPQVVLTMVREGINPLDTNINELNNQISEIKTELGMDNTQDKYSEFLWKLEKNNDITAEERDAYVGMYRLINNVEKTDGEVIGALVNQNADITLNNLLTGVRNIKNKGIDVKVDDNFGELESLTFKATSISNQIATVFNSGTNSDQGQSQSENQESETVTYYENLVDKTLRQISPDKLSQIFENGTIKDMSLEQFADELVNTQEDNQVTEKYYKEQLSIMKEASQVEEGVVKMLTDFEQPITMNNMLAANSLMTNRGSMYKKLLSNEKEDSAVTQAVDKISKSITSKDELEEAYDELEEVSILAINDQSEEPDISSIDLKQLKLLGNEIKLTTNLSKEEKYEIPVRIGDEITSINLTVLHGTDTSKVSITMENDTIGKAAAEFTLSNKTASGYIVADNQKGLQILQDNQSEFSQQLEAAGLSLNKVDYITSKKLNINTFTQEIDSTLTNTADETSARDLYSVARSFVVSMHHAGSN